MKRFFARNIDTRGRLVRGMFGTALVLAGLLLSGSNFWIGLALILAGGFVLYEAMRGWCVMRACGIKTKL